MASNSVPVEKSSCRYLDGTQHIDIATELFNTGNTVENLEVDGLIQIMDGLTYIPQLVPEELPASEYEQLSPAADAGISYQMTSSSLPAPNPDASAPSTSLSSQYFHNSYQMTPSFLPATIPPNSAPSTSSSPQEDSSSSYQMTLSLLPPSPDNNSAIPTSSQQAPEFNNLFTGTRPTAPAPKPSQRLSKATANSLKQWFDANISHPYPNTEATQMLARTNNITIIQVRKWFSNRRPRSRKSNTQSVPSDTTHDNQSATTATTNLHPSQPPI